MLNGDGNKNGKIIIIIIIIRYKQKNNFARAAHSFVLLCGCCCKTTTWTPLNYTLTTSKCVKLRLRIVAQCSDFYSPSRRKCGLNSVYLVPIKAYFTLFLSTYDARCEMKGSNEIGEFEELWYSTLEDAAELVEHILLPSQWGSDIKYLKKKSRVFALGCHGIPMKQSILRFRLKNTRHDKQ